MIQSIPPWTNSGPTPHLFLFEKPFYSIYIIIGEKERNFPFMLFHLKWHHPVSQSSFFTNCYCNALKETILNMFCVCPVQVRLLPDSPECGGVCMCVCSQRRGPGVSLLPPAGQRRPLQEHHHRVRAARALLHRLASLRSGARARRPGLRVPGAVRVQPHTHTHGHRVSDQLHVLRSRPVQWSSCTGEPGADRGYRQCPSYRYWAGDTSKCRAHMMACINTFTILLVKLKRTVITLSAGLQSGNWWTGYSKVQSSWLVVQFDAETTPLCGKLFWNKDYFGIYPISSSVFALYIQVLRVFTHMLILN